MTTEFSNQSLSYSTTQITQAALFAPIPNRRSLQIVNEHHPMKIAFGGVSLPFQYQ